MSGSNYPRFRRGDRVQIVGVNGKKEEALVVGRGGEGVCKTCGGTGKAQGEERELRYILKASWGKTEANDYEMTLLSRPRKAMGWTGKTALER